LQTSKNAVFLIISYVFSSTKSKNKRVEQVLPRCRVRAGWFEDGPMNTNTNTNVNKCKSDKIKKKISKNRFYYIYLIPQD
jgi:predicted Zn-ribbon and HTH transcriptional regulator